MKKIIIPLMAIAAFATACQVEDLNEANQGQQNGELFTIEAAITPSTKTSLTVEGDAYKVDWDADDALSVVAKYSDGTESAGFEFKKGEGNTFSGTVKNAANISEIHVVYPYNERHNSYNDEYDNVNGYITIGSEASGTQIQNGIDNTEHVQGNLYGYAEIVDGSATVNMQHATTLFEIILSNGTGSDIAVSQISLTNSENDNMVGSFYIAPKSGTISPSSAQYVSSTANLTVEGNNTVSTSQPVKFYIVSAPFDLAVNENLTVTVTTADGKEVTIVKTIPSADYGKFEAGKVNHINVEITELQEIEKLDGEYLIGAYASSIWHLMSSENSNNRYTSTKTVVNAPIDGINCNEFYYIANIDDYIWTIESYEGGYTLQSNKSQLYVSPNSKGDASAEDAPVALSIIANTDGSHTITKVGKSFELMKNSSSDFFAAYEGTQTKIALIPWEEPTEPMIIVLENEKTATFNETNVTFDYITYNIDGEISATETSDPDNIISAISASNGKTTVTLNPNTEEREKTATITLSYSGAESVELRITQKAYVPAGTDMTAVFDFSVITAVDSSVDDINFSASKADGSNEPAYNEKSKELRIYKANTFTIAGNSDNINISSIVFEVSSDNYKGTDDFNSTPEGYNKDNTTWSGNSNSVLFQNGTSESSSATQFRIKKITVTYSFQN